MITPSTQKKLAALLSGAVLFFSIVGIFVCADASMALSMSPKHNHAAMMHSCTVAQTAGCTMDLDQHLSPWHAFTQGIIALAFFAALLVIVVLARAHLSALVSSVPLVAGRAYLRSHQHFRLHDYLLTLFSRGILHTRLFA
jgi:hypothetical protein